MAIKSCPIEGYEDFTIEYPDEILVKHQRLYGQGLSEAVDKLGTEISLNEARFYDCKALCSRFEDAPDASVEEWPLAVFMWFLNAVYFELYDKAQNPPKN